MSSRRISHYRILRKLGAGGMGEVYLANDTKLHRKVAVKFIAPGSVGDARARKRLMREAQAVAKIDHPNVCSIYEIGEENGQAFIVMQYVRGESLAQRIQREPLELPEAVEIAIQVADALAEAHSQGIIHRDLKPQNIMITPRGQVKVLDFGLAKIIREERLVETDAKTETLLSQPGAILGTLPYLSPEQASEKPLDARTDIFSFGAVLYEMLTGKRPFEGESKAAILSAVLNREPPPLARYAADTPPDLERILRRCLEKDRERRYQSAREPYIDLQNLHASLHSSTAISGPRPRYNLLRRFGLPAAGAAAVLALVGILLYLSGPGQTTGDRNIHSVAVLPFAYVGSDTNGEYIGYSLTDGLIDSLSRLDNMTVIAHTSVLRYKARNAQDGFEDARAVGEDLKVQAMLTGKVVQLGDTLSITAELADARNNAHIWSGQYKRRVSDILTTPEEMAREVSGKLRPRLSSFEQARLSKRYTENNEAYQLYEKGRFFWNKRTPEDMKKAAANFQEAISVDPHYALAYSGLADCYALGAAFPSQSKELMTKAREAALNALEIDETIGEAHTSLAIVKFWYDWDWPGAEREFRRAIDLKPNYATAHQWYGEYLAVMRRLDEALGEVTEAQKIDPLSLIISSAVGRILYYRRQYDLAIEQYRKTLEMDQNFARSHIHLGMAYELKGMFPEAVSEYLTEDTLSGLSPQELDVLRKAYATDGWQGFWKKELELAMQRSKARSMPPPSYPIAQAYARLGEHDQALEWLHKAYEDKDHFLVWLNVEPIFDGLHPDRRFDDLVHRIGLP